MKQRKYGWTDFFFSLLRCGWVAAIAAAIVALSVVYKSFQTNPPVQLKVVKNTRIDLTPEQVQSIRNIGEWEFLSVSTEEFIEWHRQRTFGSDHLVRIYSGTLRIGIDMNKADKDWFTSLPDSVAQLRLPRVALLDNHFIDEARTRSFYQKGTIPAEAYDKMYAEAQSTMKRRCLTPKNLKTAEKNAIEHFTRMFKAFGFKTVQIEFK